MSRFKVGDRVVIVRSPANPWTIGAVCSVVEGPFPATTPGAAGTLTIGKPVYRLDFVLPGGRLGAVAHPEWLEPYRDDGHERGEWDELTLRCVRGVREKA